MSFVYHLLQVSIVVLEICSFTVQPFRFAKIASEHVLLRSGKKNIVFTFVPLTPRCSVIVGDHELSFLV